MKKKKLKKEIKRLNKECLRLDHERRESNKELWKVRRAVYNDDTEELYIIKKMVKIHDDLDVVMWIGSSALNLSRSCQDGFINIMHPPSEVDIERDWL